MDLNKWIRPGILAQKAYEVESTACRIKLDANENPFPLPGALREEFLQRVREILLNRYPQAGSMEVCRRFADFFGVGADMVMIGNGSDELIQILCTATGGPNTCVLLPVPTFAMYRIASQNLGHGVVEIPLDERFDLDLNPMLAAIVERRPALVFLSYPNNPTGRCFDADRIEAILDASPGIVVVDEAYFHFSGKTFLPLLSRYANLVVLRTLSKAGFAAMRIGFLIASPSLVHELNKVRSPYNVNAFSQAAASFCLDHEKELQSQVREILRLRADLERELGHLEGIRPYPTDANFIFFRCVFGADRIYRGLLRRGVLVKAFSGPKGIRDCMRVTVGNAQENREFIEAIKGVLAEVRSVI
ncbi:MAG TPA: histidinol-phosphate transaminase [Syntrophales bacterium]|nr:histidinol-phosphate transaminase [Syntrophales bacterium]